MNNEILFIGIKLHIHVFIGIKIRITQARNIRRLDGGPGPYQQSVFFQSHRETSFNELCSPAIFILTKKLRENSYTDLCTNSENFKKWANLKTKGCL